MKKLIYILLIAPYLAFANMAYPWVDGAEHSTLYGSKNCDVLEEFITIKLLRDNNFTHKNILYANYSIKYIINSQINQNLPLLFIGLGLNHDGNVKVNGYDTKLLNYDSKTPSLVKFSKTDSLKVNKDHLIYFKAQLKKGKNIVEVNYNANLTYNRTGFLRVFKLEYSLYPSKFWNSFGNINLELDLGDKIEIKTSNIGQPIIKNNIAKWQITDINVDDIELEISNKISSISKLLLLIEPFGIGLIAFILCFILHLKLVKNSYKNNNTKYKNLLVYGGALLVSVLSYIVYFLSYNVIDFSLGGNATNNHGYVLLLVVTLPFLIVVYMIVMYGINRMFKLKYNSQ